MHTYSSSQRVRVLLESEGVGIRIVVRVTVVGGRDGAGRPHLGQLLLMLGALLGRQPEVSQLDVAFGVEKYVGGLSKAKSIQVQ